MARKKAVHTVLVPYPLQGQVNPFMQLAKKLIARHNSLQVTFVNNRYNHELLIKAAINNGIHQHKEDTDQQRLKLVWIEDGLPADFDYKDIGSRVLEYYTSVQNVMFKIHLKNLLISLTDPAPDVVILGNFSDIVRFIASELNIPSVLLWTQSAAGLNVYLHIQDLIDHGFYPYTKLPESEVINYIPGMPPMEPRVLPPHLRVDDLSNVRFQVVQNSFKTINNYTAILINSFQHLEEPIFQLALQESHIGGLPPVLPVGPLLPDEAFQLHRAISNSSVINGDAGEIINSAKSNLSSGTSLLDEDLSCIQWLDTKPKSSVVYVSFGSTFTPSVEHTRALAMGIKASKQPFLWVVRPTGSMKHVSELFPEGFLEESEKDGLIIPWAPQLQVLSHPSIGAFVTHCGWNSALESIAMGVPMITFSVSMDQPINSKFITDIWQIGICIAKHTDGNIVVESSSSEDALSGIYIDSKDVAMAITIILQTEEGLKMKRRVKTLQEAAIKSVESGGTSYSAMDKVIDILGLA